MKSLEQQGIRKYERRQKNTPEKVNFRLKIIDRFCLDVFLLGSYDQNTLF